MKLSTKQILNLIAAVGAILFSVLLIIGLVQPLIELFDEASGLIMDIGNFVLKTVFIAAVAAVAVFLIIDGAKVCKNKDIKNRIIIELIVFYAIALLLLAIGAGLENIFGTLAAFGILFAMAGLGLLITSLSLNPDCGGSKTGATLDKIDFLKKLVDEGTITQEEYKKLVLKELE